MTYRLRNIAIAVALAVLAAMIVSFYVKQQKEDLQRGQTLTAVYVAKEDIPAGTPGSEIANKVCPCITLRIISLLLLYGIIWPGIPLLSLSSSLAAVKAGEVDA